MLGFAVAILVEAATGKGILSQVLFWFKVRLDCNLQIFDISKLLLALSACVLVCILKAVHSTRHLPSCLQVVGLLGKDSGF